MDGWYFGNLLFPAGAFVAVVLGGNGDIISFLYAIATLFFPPLYAGFIIDPMTGAMYKLDKESLNETLNRSPSNVQKEELKD